MPSQILDMSAPARKKSRKRKTATGQDRGCVFPGCLNLCCLCCDSCSVCGRDGAELSKSQCRCFACKVVIRRNDVRIHRVEDREKKYVTQGESLSLSHSLSLSLSLNTHTYTPSQQKKRKTKSMSRSQEDILPAARMSYGKLNRAAFRRTSERQV